MWRSPRRRVWRDDNTAGPGGGKELPGSRKPEEASMQQRSGTGLVWPGRERWPCLVVVSHAVYWERGHTRISCWHCTVAMLMSAEMRSVPSQDDPDRVRGGDNQLHSP